MNCSWRDIEEADENGWRRVACVRCGRVLNKTPHPHERIIARCKAFPFAWEAREWVNLFARALGGDEAAAMARYIRWRAGGSKVGELPPKPVLSEAEARELFHGTDPTLIGNRIAALTSAIGIPPCGGGCEKRKLWLNKAHAWLRSTFPTPSDAGTMRE